MTEDELTEKEYCTAVETLVACAYALGGGNTGWELYLLKAAFEIALEAQMEEQRVANDEEDTEGAEEDAAN